MLLTNVLRQTKQAPTHRLSNYLKTGLAKRERDHYWALYPLHFFTTIGCAAGFSYMAYGIWAPDTKWLKTSEYLRKVVSSKQFTIGSGRDMNEVPVAQAEMPSLKKWWSRNLGIILSFKLFVEVLERNNNIFPIKQWYVILKRKILSFSNKSFVKI